MQEPYHTYVYTAACYYIPSTVWLGGAGILYSLRRVRRGLRVAVPSVERSALAGTVDTALCPIVRCFVYIVHHPA